MLKVVLVLDGIDKRVWRNCMLLFNISWFERL